MNFEELTPCEMKVMCVIWNAEEPLNVHSIIKGLKEYGKEYKVTTVYTFLDHLKKKGFVDRYKKGGSYFSALISKQDFLQEYAKNIINLFGDEVRQYFL